MISKKTNLETLVLKLLKEKTEISVHDVALAAGLSKSDESDRKAIRRVLNALTDRGILQAKGAARARAYILIPPQTDETSNLFKDIPLSHDSEALLKHVSKSLKARTPIGYNQNFLRDYEPNQIFYLSEAHRSELFKIGTIKIS